MSANIGYGRGCVMANDKPKDGWDKLDIFAKVVIGIATLGIALMGGYFTNNFNQRQLAQQMIEVDKDAFTKERQTRMMELQTVESFFEHLLSDSDQEREAALETIKELNNQELYARLNNIFGTRKTKTDVGKMMASDFVSQVQIPVAPTRPIKKPPVVKPKGWAYLGSFTEQDTWETRYFTEIGPQQKPSSLKGEKLTVSKKTGDLNVREDMPDENARFFDVISVISPGTKVTVLEVKEWDSSGYWWAAIDYPE